MVACAGLPPARLSRCWLPKPSLGSSACAPYQVALSTRAGTDCVGHAIRSLTDANRAATVLLTDGIGSYDHVHRSAMMAKLLEVPSLRGLVPFVRSPYDRPTNYTWIDSDGTQHRTHQAGGGKQEDPLMPCSSAWQSATL